MGARRKTMRTLGGGKRKTKAEESKEEQRQGLKKGNKQDAKGGSATTSTKLSRRQKRRKNLNLAQATGVRRTAARRLGLGNELQNASIGGGSSSADDATDEGSLGVERDVAFFADRIELIPIQQLLPPEEEDEAAIIASKFMRNSRGQAPKQSVKEASKKAKRVSKYGDAPKSHIEMLQEHSKKAAALTKDQLADEGGEDGEGGVDNEYKPWGSAPPARSISELRKRLHAKMDQFRQTRDQAGESKSRADKRTKKGGHKGAQNDSDSHGSAAEGADADEAAERQLREQVAASISLGTMVEDGATKASAKGKRVKTRNLLDVKRMLQQVEENKAVLEELKSSSNLEDRERAKDKLWDQIEEKAKGAMLPEAKHLRKIAKRLEKKKQKSAEEWAKRKQQVEDSKNERLDKRDANIAQAKQRRIENKLKRKGVVLETTKSKDEDKSGEPASKGTRNRAGFEGRRSGFINDKPAAKSKRPKKA